MGRVLLVGRRASDNEKRSENADINFHLFNYLTVTPRGSRVTSISFYLITKMQVLWVMDLIETLQIR